MWAVCCLMTLLSLWSQFCLKMKHFSLLVPQEQAFLCGTRGPVLVDLHSAMTPESSSCPRAWQSTAQRVSQDGGPPLAENLNSTIYSWLRRLLGPVWARDTVTSPFFPACCLRCNLLQQLDEEVLSSQTAFTLPFYILMEVLQDQKFKYKFILKQSANMVLTYHFCPHY